MSLTSLVTAPTPDRERIRAALDEMTHDDRLHATRALPRALMPKLYDALAGGDRLSVCDMFSDDLGEGAVVRHHGVNSLPLFRLFEKPMFRASDGGVGGRNVQTWAWLVGHGYFTVRPWDEGDPEREVVIDYLSLPTSKPDSWPVVRSNGRLFSRFVYHNMQDVMRRVSEHVTIGKAFRNGTALGQYFILVRGEAQPALPARESRALPAAG